MKFGGFGGYEVIGFKNLDYLNEEIESCMLRRTLDQVRNDMPAKNITTELVEMSDDHRKFYEAVKQGVKDEAMKVELNANNLLSLTVRLRQATVDPSILTTETIESSKINRCVELVEELMQQNEKVVIMSSFKEPCYKLAAKLANFQPVVVTGDTKETEAEQNIENFVSNPDIKIIIGTLGKLGTGKNLNAASYLICLDEFWSAYLNNQAFDRIWRINNTRPAFVTILMCADSIDERVHEVAQMKQDLQDFMIDHKENTVSAKLKDEMLKIIKEL